MTPGTVHISAFGSGVADSVPYTLAGQINFIFRHIRHSSAMDKELSMKSDHSTSVEIIGSAVREHDQAFFVRRKKNQRFSLKRSGYISYLTEGEICVLRLSDDSPSLTIKAPAILGLAQMRSLKETHYMRCLTDCDMWDMDKDEAMVLFDRQNLWRHAFDILTQHLHMYYQKEYLNNLPNARAKVVENLKLLWSEGAAFRSQHSIYRFTLLRNKMSRSAVHKALKELESEGFIETSRGKLLRLDLPD